MLTIDPKEVPVAKLHSYLLTAVAPRQIAFASTIDAQGNPNLSPFSFFNVFSANPPILIFSPARRVRNNTTKHTLENVLATKEVVVNIVNYDMVHQMSLASTEYPEGVNEFEKAGFTMEPSELIKPYRVKESPVQLECKVNDIVHLGNEGGAGNLVICEVVKMHIRSEYLNEDQSLNQEKLDLVARAGGSYYSRAKDGFFEIPKPLSTLGIGVDALPLDVRNSDVLTGNNLGMLGNVESLPSTMDVDKFSRQHPEFMGLDSIKKHTFAKAFLEEKDVQSAWKVLLMK
jgi:flavin reductase (DIM6/NTAB) family NADH-FMN oxidoreductase RutF